MISKRELTPFRDIGVWPWVVWSLSALFYFYEYLLQVSPSVMVPELMRDFNTTATGLGDLTMFYFLAYVSLQIPNGGLLDRFGPRRCLTVAIILCAVGTLLFGHAKGLTAAEYGRLFTGLGSGFAAIGCLKIAANWFPPNRFALLAGLMLTIGMLGATFGESPLAILVDNVGWRETMIGFAYGGLVFVVLLWLIVRDYPKGKEPTYVKHRQRFGILKGLKVIVTNPQSWVVAVYAGLMFAPTSIFGALWGVSFLQQLYDISRPQAGTLVSLLFIGWAFGAPLGGWLSDFIGRRKPPMLIGALGACLCMLGIIYLPGVPKYFMGVLLFAFGFFSGGFLVSFTTFKEINPPNVNATALGFINCLNMVGAAVAPHIIGRILDYYWEGKLINGARIYSIADYHIALAILPGALIIALLLIPFIKETYCKQRGYDALIAAAEAEAEVERTSKDQ